MARQKVVCVGLFFVVAQALQAPVRVRNSFQPQSALRLPLRVRATPVTTMTEEMHSIGRRTAAVSVLLSVYPLALNPQLTRAIDFNNGEPTPIELKAMIGPPDTGPRADRRGLLNKNAIFSNDYFFKFGKLPEPRLGIDPPGGMPFVPISRRYTGYKKYIDRVGAGKEQYAKDLKKAIDDQAWDQVIELVRPSEKGVTASSASGLPLVLGLLANPLLQSENDGTQNATLLARYFANEARFEMDAILAAAMAKDKGAALASWSNGRDW
eukprot:CAMPEP_0185796362 /NCGR_PEP_ID=MMETSP1174-20130828/161040_1 /TAXON_ID=35687 /ORGANISM="Dictyocha speculum, Strain CCMP1381" /LENGTH=266 /DNA_ID=CAMNT_0028491717 /DNA_START=538 /DNA_END=1335 /DNA_ORIENTATION=+